MIYAELRPELQHFTERELNAMKRARLVEVGATLQVARFDVEALRREERERERAALALANQRQSMTRGQSRTANPQGLLLPDQERRRRARMHRKNTAS